MVGTLPVCVCALVCVRTCVCVFACMHRSTHVEVRGKPAGIGSLLPPHGPCGPELAANTFTPLAILLVLSMLSSFQDANKGERGGSSLKWCQSGTTISS